LGFRGRIRDTPRLASVFQDVILADAGAALESLGFSGSGRIRRLVSRPYRVNVEPIRSRSNTSEIFRFTFSISAEHIPSHEVFWTAKLGELTPAMWDRYWMFANEVEAASLSTEITSLVRGCIWPAAKALLHTPGLPGSPQPVWPRTFPADPFGFTDAMKTRRRTIVEEAGTWTISDITVNVRALDPRVRVVALLEILSRRVRDESLLTEVLDRLASDRDPNVREYAARVVGYLMSGDQVLRYLTAVVNEDEILRVRWSAAYALALLGSAPYT
jgi:hypothetical protein